MEYDKNTDDMTDVVYKMAGALGPCSSQLWRTRGFISIRRIVLIWIHILGNCQLDDDDDDKITQATGLSLL